MLLFPITGYSIAILALSAFALLLLKPTNFSEEHQGQQNQQERDQNRPEDAENEQRGGDPLPNRLELAVEKHPCEPNKNNNAYSKFKEKHILKIDLDNTDTNQWKTYLEQNRLCGRAKVQTFFRNQDAENVAAICNGEGHVFKDNLCVSVKKFEVFHVTSHVNNNQCSCTYVENETHNVVLACDVVDNQCVPVHYEPYKKQQPQNNIICKPNEDQALNY